MDLNDIKLFDGKTMADLAKEIYTNAQSKNQKIQNLIDTLSGMAKTKHDVASIGMTLTEGYKHSIANDEQLIKLATVVQRIVKSEGGTVKGSSYEDLLSKEEKDQLFEEARKLIDEGKNVPGS